MTRATTGGDHDAPTPEESGERPARVIAAYGADPKRWPSAERSLVLGAIGSDPALAQLRRRETALDQLLDGMPGYTPAAALRERILAATLPATTSRWHGLLALVIGRAGAPWWLRPAPAFAVAMALGVFFGATWPADDTEALAAQFVALAFGYDYQVAEPVVAPVGSPLE